MISRGGEGTLLDRKDSLSAANVAALVNTLNAEVLQAAAMMADTLEIRGPRSHNDEKRLDMRPGWSERLAHALQ